MYWTLDSNADPFGPVTLCDKHALEATELGAKFFGLGPWDTMDAAAVELEAISAIFGDDSVRFGFTTSDVGTCSECEHEALVAHLFGDGAA